MRPRISIRGSVCPSIRPSVCPSPVWTQKIVSKVYPYCLETYAAIPPTTNFSIFVLLALCDSIVRDALESNILHLFLLIITCCYDHLEPEFILIIFDMPRKMVYFFMQIILLDPLIVIFSNWEWNDIELSKIQ